MQETILCHQLSKQLIEQIEPILKSLNVKLVMIDRKDMIQTMGYLLGYSEFEERKGKPKRKFNQPILFFVDFADEQITVLLEIFQRAQVPYIAYKAKLSSTNVYYSFEDVYTNVENEYRDFIKEK